MPHLNYKKSVIFNNVFSFSIEYGGNLAIGSQESEYAPHSISSTYLSGLIFIWDPFAKFLLEEGIKNINIKKSDNMHYLNH